MVMLAGMPDDYPPTDPDGFLGFAQLRPDLRPGMSGDARLRGP
jgi:hypothetical protein